MFMSVPATSRIMYLCSPALAYSIAENEIFPFASLTAVSITSFVSALTNSKLKSSPFRVLPSKVLCASRTIDAGVGSTY